MSDAKRPAIRFPAQIDSAEIVARAKGRVLDESQSGIAIVVDAHFRLVVGQQVEIDYAGAAMKAIVRRVEEHADASRTIGFQWQ